MALVYLVSTRCHDLITELLLIAQKLPMDKLLLFFSYLRPLSLAQHVAENVPQLKERFARFRAVFNNDNKEVIKQSLTKSSSSRPTSMSLSAQVKDSGSSGKQLSQDTTEKEMTVCTPTLQVLTRQISHPRIIYASVVSAGSYPRYPNASQPLVIAGGLAQSSSNLNSQPSGHCNQEGNGKKDEVPFAMSNKHVPNRLDMNNVKQHKSIAMVQGKMGCENCIDVTCPRCIQAQSISMNHFKRVSA